MNESFQPMEIGSLGIEYVCKICKGDHLTEKHNEAEAETNSGSSVRFQNSRVPLDITNRLIEGREIKPNFHGSTIIENFITQQIDKKITDSKLVEKHFLENTYSSLKLFLEGVNKEARHFVNNSEIYNHQVKSEILEDITALMTELELSDYIKSLLANTSIELTNEGNTSQAEASGKVIINMDQIVRRAVDYQLAFDIKSDLKEIVKAKLKYTITHELGHVINNKLNSICEKARNDNWSNKSERFAEFWAKEGVKDKLAQDIAQKLHLLDVSSVAKMWQSLNKLNNKLKPDKKIDVSMYVDAILKASRGNPLIKKMVEARSYFYLGDHAPENYALPYNKTEIKEILNKSS